MQQDILKADEAQRYTLGIVYSPDTVDSQGDYSSADEIEKACWGFMRKLQGKDAFTKTALSLLDSITKALDDDTAVSLDVTSLYEDIEKRGLNDMHLSSDTDEELGEIVECYCAPADLEIAGEYVAKGSWLLGVKWSDDYFEKVKAGERTGFSMEGRGIRMLEGSDE